MADTSRALALAKEIRAARSATGMPLVEVARAVGWSESKISRIETGKSGVKPDDLAELLDALQVRGADREHLLQMARDAQQTLWWELGLELPKLQSAFVYAEQHAQRIVHVSMNLVPGLMQTRAYTREVMRVGGVDEEQVEDRVSFRQMRQGVLTRKDPVELHSFLDEAALARCLGSSALMADQLRHVVDVIEYDNVTLRVLPSGHAALAGGFVLFEFSHPRAAVYLESTMSGALIDEPEDVQHFRETAALLEKQAADVESSRAILKSYLKKYESEAR